MIQIERFINELMTSNCYIVWDNAVRRCIIIDPASEKSLREIDFIDENGLQTDYIILTHEHTDHTWGVNALVEKYSSAKVVCSQICKENLPLMGDMYFRLYYEDKYYHYEVERVDYTIEQLDKKLNWNGTEIRFISTPGHSMGSVCIDIEGKLFTGDTIMQTKPYINKRNGSKILYIESVEILVSNYSRDTMVFPGHGEIFFLKDMM